jgi:uncharacterized protein YcbK (DUF882 family)
LRHAHTRERFDGPYRDANGPIPTAMTELGLFLRDHHTGVPGPVALETVDILYEVLEAAGQSRATVLSAFRTPETNRKLADRLYGVAEKSQHLHGRAIDITLDRGLARAHQAALTLKRGGVGWYPNSHFLHLDSGPVRSWSLGGAGLQKGFDADAIVSGARPPRPFTEKQRAAIRRALAKKQWRDRR